MARIFISYRHEDAGMGVGRLTDALREHFTHEQVFQDISSIDPGADFVEALNKALADCAAVLVVIGPKWVSAADRHGRRRLEDPDDWVRREVAEALSRPSLPVFPLLVDGATMPDAEELPVDLKGLVRRQASELTLRHWAQDIASLATMLRKIPSLGTVAPPPPAASAGPRRRSAPWKIALVSAILVAGAALWYFLVPPGPSEVPTRTSNLPTVEATTSTAHSSDVTMRQLRRLAAEIEHRSVASEDTSGTAQLSEIESLVRKFIAIKAENAELLSDADKAEISALEARMAAALRARSTAQMEAVKSLK